jgi:hypothetical protein
MREWAGKQISGAAGLSKKTAPLLTTGVAQDISGAFFLRI